MPSYIGPSQTRPSLDFLPTEYYRKILELCCYVGHVDALKEALEVAKSGDLLQTAVNAIPTLYEIATCKSDTDLLGAIRSWSTFATVSLGVPDFVKIVKAAQLKLATHVVRATSKAVLHWWLDNLDFGRDDTSIQVANLMLIWTISTEHPECFLRALEETGQQLYKLLQDADEHGKLVVAIGLSRQIIELCQIFQQTSSTQLGVQALSSEDVTYLLNCATLRHDLDTLIYLVHYTTAAGRGEVVQLSQALDTAFQANNFSAALFLRIHNASTQFVHKPLVLTQPVWGEEEFRRRAMNILFDDAWNVMQHTGDSRQKSHFERARGQIDEAMARVVERVGSVATLVQVAWTRGISGTNGVSPRT